MDIIGLLNQKRVVKRPPQQVRKQPLPGLGTPVNIPTVPNYYGTKRTANMPARRQPLVLMPIKRFPTLPLYSEGQ